MSRLLRFFTLFAFVSISTGAYAAGYTCPSSKKYTSCSSGYYMTKGGTYNGTPVAGNACTACPSGYTCAGGTANKVAATKTCAAGKYWNGSACANCGGNAYYCPGFSNISNPSSGYGRNSVSSGYYSTGGDANTRTGQSKCGGNAYYCSGGVRNSVSAGYYSTGGDSTTRTGQSQCAAGNYCSNGVKSDCPDGYTANTDNGKTSASQCQLRTTAGLCIEYHNRGTNNQTPCGAGYYCPSALINYGDFGSWGTCADAGDNMYSTGGAAECTACLAGYTITGDTVSDHDAASDCKINCAGGTYLATENDSTCTNVGIGYWTAASTISQGEVGVRTQCPAGLTTIGYGAGADEAGDCGRVLNIGDNKIYLRSDKKTEKSMAVGINGDVFYGNMSTDGPGALRVTSDGVTYSVYDDSML